MKRFFCICMAAAALFILCGYWVPRPKVIKGRNVRVEKLETSGKYVLTDTLGNILSKEYNYIDNNQDGVIIYRSGKKYGLLDSTGTELTRPVYNYMEDDNLKGYAVAYKKGFVEGNCNNGFASPKELGKAGLIDSRGNVVIPFIYDDLYYFWDDDEGIFSYVLNGKGGYIDTNGCRLTKPVYDDCWGHHLGYARVRKGKGYGMVDNRGNEVIPCGYDYVDYIGKKRFAVKKDGMYSLAAEGGKLLSDFVCDSIENSYRAERAFPVWVMKGDDYAFMNEAGELITGFDFKVTKDTVKNWDNSSHILRHVSYVGRYIYQYGVSFNEADSVLVVNWYDEDDYYGGGPFFMTHSGPVPDSLKHYYRERLFPVYDGERYGYINDRGEMAVPFRYDKAEMFREGLAAVQRNGKWGFIDQKGNEVIPPKFDRIDHVFSGGRAIIYDKESKKSYFIDREGNITGVSPGGEVIIVP